MGFALRPETDPDLWGHLRFGQYFLEAGLPPQPDIFSYASTETWIDHEWLCEVIYFLAWREMGPFGYYFVKALAGIFLMGLLLYHIARGTSPPNRDLLSPAGTGFPAPPPLLSVAVAFCAAFLTMGNGMLLRPQLFTYILMAAVMHIYIMEREGRERWLYLCPVITAFWANLHAGVVAGIGIMVLCCAGDILEVALARRRGAVASWRRPVRLGVALIVSIAATLITPYGPSYWAFLWHATTLPREYITEWAPIVWGRGDAAYLVTAGVFLVCFVRSRVSKTPTELLLFIVTLYLGLTHKRHMMLFAIVAGFTITPHVTDALRGIVSTTPKDDLTPKEVSILRAVYGVVIVAILAAFGVVFARRGVAIPVDTSYYPVGATRFIRENNISGNLYPTFNWGQYAIWHLHPQCRVGADGRYETVYSRAHEKPQMAFDVGHEGWEAVLDTFPTEIVMCPNKYHLRLFLAAKPEWVKVYEDTNSMVLLKNVPRFAETIDRARRGELVQPRVASREYFP